MESFYSPGITLGTMGRGIYSVTSAIDLCPTICWVSFSLDWGEPHFSDGLAGRKWWEEYVSFQLLRE